MMGGNGKTFVEVEPVGGIALVARVKCDLLVSFLHGQITDIVNQFSCKSFISCFGQGREIINVKMFPVIGELKVPETDHG